MLDGKQLTRKLVGSDDERAVSPVIGVILMVAITVILAAVIAAFVLDLGDSVDQEAQAGVTIDVDQGEEEVQVEVTSLGNADHINITSNDWDDLENDDDEVTYLTVGDTETYSYDSSNGDIQSSGTISAVAVINETDTQTQVESEDWDF